MEESKIYYNPNCGTCRKVREAMEAKGLKPVVIEYLRNPPSAQELDQVLRMAGLAPEQAARKKEEVYAKLKLSEKKLDRQAWLKILTENPVLIERPLVVIGKKAILARPPERVQEIL